MMESTVYVVAWEYYGGGGFDWYYTREDATAAWEAEQRNVEAAHNDGWTAYYVAIDGIDTTDPDAATEEIDYLLAEFLPDDRPYIPGVSETWR